MDGGMNNPVIELKELWKTYYPGKLRLDALKGINLSLNFGDFIAVAGPSGSGKTTLMNIIGLIDKGTSGSLRIDGREAGALSMEEQTALRRESIGFIFQSFNLLPALTVFENVELPMLLDKKLQRGGNKAARRERVLKLLEAVHLGDRLKHKPAELSGGQQQRAAIARALVMNPKIVIADEPTANLDSENGGRVLALMKKVNKENGTTFIFSTHDSKIWEMADHVIFLQDGEIKSETRKQAA